MNANLQRQLQSAKTITSVLHLAKSDPRLVATPDQCYRDAWLLDTPAATADFTTGQMLARSRPACIPTSPAVSPGGDSPQWRAFIHQTPGGAARSTGFIQRMCGYALTGSTQEQCLFFLYGRGANGKSVLLNTVAGVLGDHYHKTAPIETFTESHTERHPTELAGLRGARLVTAIETEEGRRWNENKIETLTRSDKIASRLRGGKLFRDTTQF